jgi:5,5'-dehydrodivanillate O-demethylase
MEEVEMAATTNGKRQHSKAEYRDFVHTGPGTLAGRYLRRFWHPMYRAQDLALGQTKPIRIMGEDFTLYRGRSGKPYVVAFRCPHRGTQLSVGWVEEECIRCMYHGWKFDGAGRCVEQPAEDPGYTNKIRIRSCPAEEYLGLIFAYLGEGEPPPLPHYPRFEKEGILENLPVQYWPCNYFQRLENHGDVVHVVFVHRYGFLVTDARDGVPTLRAEESDWGWTSIVTFPGGERHIYQFGMPNIHDFRLPSPHPEAAWDDRIQWMVPVDDERSMVLRVRYLPITGEAVALYREHRKTVLTDEGPSVAELGDMVLSGRIATQDMRYQTRNKITLVNAQDYVAQVGQGTIVDRKMEHLGRSDVGVIVLRKIWERELRALAEGQPLKNWSRPDDMQVVLETHKTGVGDGVAF